MTAIRRRPETLAQGILLAVVGGYLDAFTFVGHGVFANAQTGNVVLFGVEAANTRWHEAFLHLAPVAAFVTGAVVVEALARPDVGRRVRRPVRVVVIIEILVLAIVASLPKHSPALLVTIPVSLVAAIQFSTFRTLVDTSYSTLMATGNLRGVVSSLHQWVARRDRMARRQATRLSLVVAGFVLGAVTGTLATKHLANLAAGIPAGILFVLMVILIRETRRTERASAMGGTPG